MSSLSPVSEALTAMANWMMAFAACAGAIAAFIGLDTWRKQSLWQQDNELARMALLRLRQKADAFHALRGPFVSAGEMITALNEAGKEYTEDQGWAAAIDRRFRRLSDANEQIFPTIVETSTVWSDQIEVEFRKLSDIEMRVRFAIEDVHRQNQSERRVAPDEVSTRRVAFSSGKDETAEEYELIVDRLKSVFKQKLGRKW